jgi:uncharacterized protein YbcC (UPF0753/DUF2309 family)
LVCTQEFFIGFIRNATAMETVTVQDDMLVSIAQAVESALRAIPPVWPLASSVAVNPFLGQAGESLAQTAARLGRVAGIAVTMPRSWYLERIESRAIAQVDLEQALAAAPSGFRPANVAALIEAARQPADRPEALPTVADLAAEVSGIDWPGVVADRLGAWALGYFDLGQAIWAAPRGRSAYSAWRAVATHDLTPEIIGLAGFAMHVARAPRLPTGAINRAVSVLDLSSQALTTYFHRLLMTLGGWAHYARYQLWQAELAGRTDATLADLLAIRLVWEEALYERYAEKIASRWSEVCPTYAAPLEATPNQVIDVILQEAAEHAAQRALATVLDTPLPAARKDPPTLQAVFCIDVRSEVFRRALESISPEIQTLGFAGFFGLTAAHRRFASDVTELRLPVLLNPGIKSVSGGPDDAAADQSARFKLRAKRAWGRFKLAAVSSFAFVEATGPLYVGKLLRDALALDDPGSAADDPAPYFDPPLDLGSRVKTAETVLRAMSLTDNFARLVILVGHGATVVNNPHASALHCGACGGYSGEVNARLLAALLNDQAVREALAGRGIVIPPGTLFLGALHDTTTDAVKLYTQDHDTANHSDDIRVATARFDAAGFLTRTERARRLPHATERRIRRRSLDWSEVRPEWSLAGCQAFIAAPRHRTAGRNLKGRAFLHDYDWAQDAGFGVLELIMTAPVVVASWISLQYYGSTVAPDFFGGGNKLLHNVAGGIGVVEGTGGMLRAGLPWQSVHDGESYVHEPLRLSVCIEAPQEAMTDILRKHAGVRALFDNRWLYLFRLDEAGLMASRYAGDLRWTESPFSSMSSTVTSRLKAVS